MPAICGAAAADHHRSISEPYRMLQKSRLTSTLNIHRPPRENPRATSSRRRLNGSRYAAPADGKNEPPDDPQLTVSPPPGIGGGTQSMVGFEIAAACTNGANVPCPG